MSEYEEQSVQNMSGQSLSGAFKMEEKKAVKMAKMMFEYLTGGKKDYLEETEVLEILKIAYLGVRTESPLTLEDISSYINVHGGGVMEGKIVYQEFEDMVVRLLTLREKEQIDQLNQKREEVGVFKENLRQELNELMGEDVVEQEIENGMNLFQKYDVNRNGFLEEFEIPQLLIDTYQAMDVDYEPTEEDVYNYIKSMDNDEDGRISAVEYELFLLQSLQSRGFPSENIDNEI